MSALVASLEAEELGAGRYRFPVPPEGRGVVFGGHLLAQMCVAAARAAAGEGGAVKAVRSASGIFARTVGADRPDEVSVDVLHTGRVLASATASVWQDGTERARGLVLLSAAESDLIRHQAPAPEVGGPGDAIPVEDPLGREVRVVGGLDREDPDVVAPPRLAVWVRHPGATADSTVARALLAHSTAGFLMGTAMLPHRGIGERMAHQSFSTGIVAHAVSVHDDVDAGRWILVTQESTHAGGGRAYGAGQVFTEEGTLLASFNQEAIIRPFPEGHTPKGRESTIL